MQEGTLSSHLHLWKLHLERLFDEPTADQFYMAQLAREVHCVLMKREDRNKLKNSDFVLKFTRPKRKKAPARIPKPVEPEKEEILDLGDDEERMEEVKKRTLASKAAWFALAGIGEKVKYEDN